MKDDDDDNIAVTFEYVPIDEYVVPSSFSLGKVENIKVTYTLMNGCYRFDDIHYENDEEGMIIAVKARVQLGVACTESITKGDYTLPIEIKEQKNYILKFWKGTDVNGENIFEKVSVPVN